MILGTTSAPCAAASIGNMQKPIIEVSGLTRRYGDFTAVDNISFQVAKGTCFGLLGTNGAGKTSTLDILEGLASATSGSVQVLGMDPIAQRKKLRPHLGIMLQHGALPVELSVKETLVMWAGTCSTPKPVEEILESVDLLHKADTRVGSLSGGEQRRLDLACALVGSPSVIFLDEPTTGLDPESRANTWELLANLKASGVTMVLTTHYLEEAEMLCDSMVIMHRGVIRAQGSVKEIRQALPAQISFSLNNHHLSLPQLDGTVSTHGDIVVVHTQQLQKDAFALLSWADANSVELRQFSAQPASLMQVFESIAKQP